MNPHRNGTANISVQMTPVCTFREFLTQVSGAPE